jgi:thiaminase/transcriptional activator TenA
MGYGEIGTRLKAEQSSDEYKEWIDTYAGDEYQENCANVGQLVDNALVSRLGPASTSSPRWGVLAHKFNTATRLEVGFWDMGLRGA